MKYVMHIPLFFLVITMMSYSSAELVPMTFKAPVQSEEESHSSFLPDALKCDACQAIAHQVHLIFTNFNKIHKHFKYNLPESEVIDLVEKSCDKENYNNYGLKAINGENRLNGPGVTVSDSVAGMIAGGGKWPYRLTQICLDYVEHLGDMGFYDLYKNEPKKQANFYEKLCMGNSDKTSACKDMNKKKNNKKNEKDPESESKDEL